MGVSSVSHTRIAALSLYLVIVPDQSADVSHFLLEIFLAGYKAKRSEPQSHLSPLGRESNSNSACMLKVQTIQSCYLSFLAPQHLITSTLWYRFNRNICYKFARIITANERRMCTKQLIVVYYHFWKCVNVIRLVQLRGLGNTVSSLSGVSDAFFDHFNSWKHVWWQHYSVLFAAS